MKKVFLLLLTCLLIGKLSIGQLDTTVAPPLSKSTGDRLLQKSRNKKAVAWVLFGAGAGLGIAGLAVGESAIGHLWSDPLDRTASRTTTGGALILAGGVSMLGSIPFFISSAKNKRRALLSVDNGSVIPGPMLHRQNLIAVALRINLGTNRFEEQK